MKKKFSLFSFSIPFILFLLFISCSEENISEPPPEYVYQIPEQIGDGWETASLEDVGIVPDKLIEIADYINCGLVREVHSILIIKNGKLVFEEYFKGHTFDFNGTNHHGHLKEYDKNTIHNQASVTKSFTSALIGIAIDKGFINSVEEKVINFFPEYSEYNVGDMHDLTIEHLLTMSAGFQWNEMDVRYSNNQNDLIQMWQVSDPLEYLVSKTFEHSPGSHFYYHSGLTNLLGEIIYKASEIKPDVFADQYLFNKLGINNRTWEKFRNGVVFVSGDLKICPRDMAKFGYLYLNEGKWKGGQIISEEWTQKSVSKHISVNSMFDYGYKWWLRDYSFNSDSYSAYSARGWGGQQITVIPELDLVIVFTGGNYTTAEPVDDIIIQYILPSMITEKNNL